MRSDEKPVRDLEAIMQREQDKAALESEATAAADQARYDKNTSFQDIRCTLSGTSDSMELCGTTDMLEMFGEYYDADKEDAASRSVNATTIESAYDFNDKCFGLTYQGEGSFIHSCTGAAVFDFRCGGARTRCAHPTKRRTQHLVR